MKKGTEVLVLNVTSATEIVKQFADGKQQPAAFSDLKTGAEVVVMHAGEREKSDPPQALARRIIILGAAK